MGLGGCRSIGRCSMGRSIVRSVGRPRFLVILLEGCLVDRLVVRWRFLTVLVEGGALVARSVGWSVAESIGRSVGRSVAFFGPYSTPPYFGWSLGGGSGGPWWGVGVVIGGGFGWSLVDGFGLGWARLRLGWSRPLFSDRHFLGVICLPVLSPTRFRHAFLIVGFRPGERTKP